MANSGTLYPTGKPEYDLHNGKFTNGNAQAGLEPSVLDADTLNLVLDNLQGAIEASGLTPDNAASSVNQLKKSLLWAAGQWQEGTDYLAGAQVLHSGILHLCTQNHTATTANAPGQNNAPWALLATDASIAAAINRAESRARRHADTQDAAHDLALLKKIYPVEAIYMYYGSVNPGSFLGFGTWTNLPSPFLVNQRILGSGNRKVIKSVSETIKVIRDMYLSSFVASIFFWRRTA